MTEPTQSEAVATLLRETAKAHHEAFAATDGDDPEWPIWYAEYLKTRLPAIVGSDLTLSRLVHTLVQLDDEYTTETSDLAWPEYWAAGILKRYAS